jgi:Rha family phage regulatory protein
MIDLAEFVSLHDTTLTTDSRRVAKHFHKRHDNVLQSFDRLSCSQEFSRLNFQVAEELDEQDKPRRVIHMTKNGFMFLAMGFAGAKAARIKETYIGAFDKMAEQLQQIQQSGFLSLWQQRMALEKRDASSFEWASFGSRRMLERRRDLPSIVSERARLDEKIQPPLVGFDLKKSLHLVKSESQEALHEAA